MRPLILRKIPPIPIRLIVLITMIGYMALAIGVNYALNDASYPVSLWVKILVRMIPAGALMGVGFLIHKTNPSLRIRRGWTFIGAYGCLSIAGIIHALLLETFPSQSIVLSVLQNLILLIAYPVLLTGLLALFPFPERRSEWYGIGLDITVPTISIIGVSCLLLIGPVLDTVVSASGGSFLTAILPIVDLAVLTVTIILFLRTDQHRQGVIFSVIGASLSILLISDFLLIFYTFQPMGIDDGPVNTFKNISLLILVLAGFLQLDPKLIDKQPSAPVKLVKQQVNQMLPFATVILMAVASIFSFRVDQAANFAALLIASLCVVLLILKQGINASERELRQFAVLVDSIAEPVFICNEQGQIHVANPAFWRLIGISFEGGLPNIDLERLLGDTTSAMDLTKTGTTHGWSGETTLFTDRSEPIPVFLTLRPMRRATSIRRSLAGTAYDLTEAKHQQHTLQKAYEEVAAARSQLEGFNATLEQHVAEKTASLTQAYAQLEQQNRTLQKIDELKSDFVSLVSHELRAPLTNISSGIELILEDRDRLDGATTGTLKLVQSEIRRLSSFVETILDVSTLDAGRIPFQSVPISLPHSVDGLKKQFAHIPDTHRIRWSIAPNLPYVLADERAISSIFLHLIDNACKYAPQGDIDIAIHKGTAGRVEIEVCDHGPGFPPDTIPLLFEKFYRVQQDDAQTVYGHGLGLYIVRRLLLAMDGDIQVENRSSGGARFCFWLHTVEERDEPENLAGG